MQFKIFKNLNGLTYRFPSSLNVDFNSMCTYDVIMFTVCLFFPVYRQVGSEAYSDPNSIVFTKLK